MASPSSKDSPGEAPELLEGKFIQKIRERIERLPDGRYKRTTNVVRVGPADNKQVATISAEELETLFRDMYTTRESAVIAMLPGYGTESTVIQHLQMKKENDNQQVSGEGSQLGFRPAPAQVNPSQETRDAVPAASPDVTRQPAVQPEDQARPFPSFGAHAHHPLFQSTRPSFKNTRFLSGTPSVDGTVARFEPRKMKDEYLKDRYDRFETITAQPYYIRYSLEELRVVDYANGHHRAATPGPPHSFGAAPAAKSLQVGGSAHFATLQSSRTDVKYPNDGSVSFDFVKEGDASGSSSTSTKPSTNAHTSLSPQEKFKLRAGGSGSRKIASATKRNTAALRSRLVHKEAGNISQPTQSGPPPF